MKSFTSFIVVFRGLLTYFALHTDCFVLLSVQESIRQHVFEKFVGAWNSSKIAGGREESPVKVFMILVYGILALVYGIYEE